MFSLTQLLFTICLCPASNRTRLPIYSDSFFVCFCSRIIKKISTFTRLFSFLNQNTPTSHERPPIPAPLPLSLPPHPPHLPHHQPRRGAPLPSRRLAAVFGTTSPRLQPAPSGTTALPRRSLLSRRPLPLSGNTFARGTQPTFPS